MSSRNNQRKKEGKQSGKGSQVKSNVGKTVAKTASKSSHKMSASKRGPVKIASATKIKGNVNKTKQKHSLSSGIHRRVSFKNSQTNYAETRRSQNASHLSNHRNKQSSSSRLTSGAGKSKANLKRSQSSTKRSSGQASKHSIGKVEKSEGKLQLVERGPIFRPMAALPNGNTINYDLAAPNQLTTRTPTEPLPKGNLIEGIVTIDTLGYGSLSAKDQAAADTDYCSSILDSISESEAMLMRQFDEQLKLESELNTEFNSQMIGAIRDTYDATLETMNQLLEQVKQTGNSATVENALTVVGKQSAQTPASTPPSSPQ